MQYMVIANGNIEFLDLSVSEDAISLSKSEQDDLAFMAAMERFEATPFQPDNTELGVFPVTPALFN